MKLTYAQALTELQTHGLLLAKSPHALLAASSPEGEDGGELVTASQEVSPGAIFIAYRGVATDSHQFLREACRRGAGLLIVEDLPQDLGAAPDSPPWLQVSCGRSAWSWLSAAAAGHPQNKLRVYGVTGTNGKTSSVWMLRSLLAACGIKSLSVGTLGFYWGDEVLPSPHTTPDPNALFPALQRVVKEGGDTVVMEVSSHAMAHKKLAPLKFAGASWTNFTRDHLDLHGSMEAYWQCKWQLFSHHLLPGSRVVWHQSLQAQLETPPAELSADLWWYASKPLPHAPATGQELSLKACRLAASHSYLDFLYEGKRYAGAIPYVGAYNCENFLNAWLLASHRLGQGVEPIYWQRLEGVPGRLELLPAPPERPAVFVDYAHSPDALAQALQTLRPLCRGQLWVVFGCGGNRDQGKRPQMGAMAATYADRLVVTSDNPREEEAEAIIAAICAGVPSGHDLQVVSNREQAIAFALAAAASEDLVLIAGRGPEPYQIIKGQKIPFDDRVVAGRLLAMKGSSPC